MGQHLVISDGFELEPVDFDLWEKYQDLPEFKKLKDFNNQVEGKVVTTVVHEDSIQAEILGDVFQEDRHW